MMGAEAVIITALRPPQRKYNGNDGGEVVIRGDLDDGGGLWFGYCVARIHRAGYS